ncbi:RlpA-like double-psi beta-barrel domain-containing protein [Sporobolomyces koalae]|uniref:RlpA-like double-psi beta-barrel domain-containing protein n=1 Tax=Sporobolomyces koalae TaxID=500713 RepID=UPI00317F9432
MEDSTPAGEVRKKKVWTMRSGPARGQTDSQRYDPVAGDDRDDGLDAAPAADYSATEKGYDGINHSEDETDPEANGTEGKTGKKVWIWVALAAVLLLLLLLGIYFFWLRSKPASSSSSSASTGSSSSLNVSSARVPSSSPPVTTLPSRNVTVATAPALSPVPSSAFNKPTQTKTASAVDSAATYFAQITWFNDEHLTTPCGSNPNDGDYVVRVSRDLYGDSKAVSSLCGRWISLYQLETDSYTKATIEGVCSTCIGHNIDLSRATFWALTQNMKLGTTLAQWWWTAPEDQPENTLSRGAVQAITAAPKPVATSGSNISAGFEPLEVADEPNRLSRRM